MSELALRDADRLLSQALDLAGEARECFLDESCGPATPMRALLDRLVRAGESEFSSIVPGGGAGGPLWQELSERAAGRAALAAGDRLGVFRVIKTLGRGGMATVYLAERADGRFEHSVALKVLDAPRDYDELAARFEQERQILATLDHPNIARLVDGGVTPDGLPYVAMEYVDGLPIDAYCDQHRLTISDRAKLFEKVADAVQYAHRHLIVHRDIKPSNILVKRDGEPRLLDFGIAKLLDPATPHAAPETRSALHPMTPEYASPEQVRGEPLTTASDVYQLGYLLYQLLTGRRPYRFDRHNFAEVVHAICNVEPMRLGEASLDSPQILPGESMAETSTLSALRGTTPQRLRRDLNGDLGRIVLMALNKEPAARYASVEQLREDLRRYSQGRPILARAPSLRYRAGRFVRRHRAGVSAAAAMAVLLAGGVAATVWQAQLTAREARRAAEVRDFLIGLFESAEPDATLGQTVTAKELLDRGAAELGASLAAEPELRAEMLGVVGRIYRELGLFSDAEPLLTEALSVQRDLARRELIAGSSEDLAAVLYEQADYEAAERLARDAVRARRRDADRAPGQMADSLSTLASILSARGAADEADALHREAIELDRRRDDRERLAAHLTAYAAQLQRATRYDEGQRLLEEALSLRRELYGAEHTRVATSLLSLAAMLMERGEYTAAERSAREALEMRRKLLGDAHPHVANAWSELGSVFSRAGKLDDAEAAHREALAIRRAVFGDDHMSVGASLNEIGVSLYFETRFAEAAQAFAQVLPIWRTALGPYHQDVFSVMNNLGAALREAGDYPAAAQVLRETLELRREAFGDDNRFVAQSYNNLALVLEMGGDYDEAEDAFNDAVAIWRRTMGEAHPDVGDGLRSMGKFLLERGRFAEAEPVLREAVEIHTATLDAQAPLLASARLYLGECLLELDRPGEAGALLAASLPVLTTRWGEDAPITQRARRDYEQVQTRTGDPAP